MSQANRVDPRAKQLKDLYATINHSPRRAKESPLLQKKNLERLLPALHLSSDCLDTSPDERIRQIGKALTLSFFLPELKKEKRGTNLMQGLLFFWHSYLAPVAAIHPAPPIATVIGYCADSTNLREFLQEAQHWTKEAHTGDAEALRAVLELLTPENLRKTVLIGLPKEPNDSERRTYGNYLNAAARELALRLESLVPDLFAESAPLVQQRSASQELDEVQGIVPAAAPVQIKVHPPKQLDWVARQMIDVGFRLPGLGGEVLRADSFLDRTIVFSTLRGQPRLPAFLTGADADVKGFSGFLSGVLGSGRTAYLKSLTYQYARQYLSLGDGTLAYYLSAGDFVIHARNRRSIHEFIGDKLAAWGGSTDGIEDLPEILRRLDRAGKLLVLVDDLDRLSDLDQSEVLSLLTFSPGVVFAVLPWQVERLATMTTRPHLGLYSLPPLCSEEQLALIDRISAATKMTYAQSVVERQLRELPDLAQIPLGVVTVLDQAAHAWTDATQVVKIALDECLRRAGLPLPPFQVKNPEFTNEWFHLQGAASQLLMTLQQPEGYEYLKGDAAVTVTRFMVENPNGYAWQTNWDQLARTGLFRPIPHPTGEGLALVNRDLTCYLLAQEARAYLWNLELPPRPLHPEAVNLLRRASRHLENLKDPNRGVDVRPLPAHPRSEEPSSRKPKTRSWWERFPEIFRILS